MKKSVLAIMVGALCIILSSCQETPEESSVVSKVDGISEAAVCEPLKKGEKRETNVPTHWKFEENRLWYIAEKHEIHSFIFCYINNNFFNPARVKYNPNKIIFKCT